MRMICRLVLLLLVTVSVGSVCVSAQVKCSEYDYECRINANPKDAEAFYVRAFVVSEGGKIEQAIADLTRYFELTPVAAANKQDMARAYQLRAQCYDVTRKFAEALADYTKAIELDSRDARYFVSRARYYIRDSKKAKAYPDALKAVELAPTDPEVYSLLADSEIDHNKELADRSKYISMIGDDKKLLPAALNYRAHTYMNLNKLDLAEADLTRAISLTPNDRDLYRARAIVYGSLGKHELAAADLEKLKTLP